MEEKNQSCSLNMSIIKIRVALQKANLRKSGRNRYAGFEYFELADFLPTLNELMLAEGVNDRFIIADNVAILELIKGDEIQIYQIPFQQFPTPLTYKKDRQGNFLRDENGALIQVPSMQDVQYLGALNTYYKRYLYINAFGITDGEVISTMNNDSDEFTPQERKATQGQLEILRKVYQGELLDKLLAANNLDKLEDITITKASELIKKLKGAKDE